MLDKFNDTLKYCKSFLKHLEIEETYIDYRSLFLAVKSCYDDIDRYKEYHIKDKAGLSNSVKRAAYMCKWINRFKPIQQKLPEIDLEVQLDDISTMFINEAFALYLGQLYIATELDRDFYYSPKYLDEFYYDLLYRELGTDGLLHIFQNIYSAVKVGRAGVLDFPYDVDQVESVLRD